MRTHNTAPEPTNLLPAREVQASCAVPLGSRLLSPRRGRPLGSVAAGFWLSSASGSRTARKMEDRR